MRWIKKQPAWDGIKEHCQTTLHLKDKIIKNKNNEIKEQEVILACLSNTK